MSGLKWGLVLFFLSLLACSSSQDLKKKETAQSHQSDRQVSDTPENSLDKAMAEWETRVIHQPEGNVQNTSQMVQGWIDEQVKLVEGNPESQKHLKLT